MAKSHGIIYSAAQSPQHPKSCGTNHGVELRQQSNGHLLMLKSKVPNKGLWHICLKLRNAVVSRGSSLPCRSTELRNAETTECVRHNGDSSGTSRAQGENEHPTKPEKIIHSTQGLAEACKFVHNDAKYVNERARSDIVMLSRSIKLTFYWLARAREDTEKIDHNVKRRAEGLHQIATILKNKAQSKLKTVADRHWSDGALEADLRRADFCAKQRAMEDALLALEFIKNIHDMMVSKMYKFPYRKKGSLSTNDMAGRITLEKNGKTLAFFPWGVSTDGIAVIQEAYWSIASALSEADGIDYTDPEELELLVTTLINLDAMDGKSSVSLLAECSSSPDVNTRKALANALAAAPSMWTLGNAGMGALQRLAEDSNPAIAAAASKTIYELKKQWEIEEGDSWRFMMNQKPVEEVDGREEDGAETS
ncbi:unnamed protein product [Ilex paraguariensis]|uniref:Senescence-associated protein SPA15, chloroplastic n=1 Tax=Ilex paraguariensis TaxID=185542 RepID=A0ABC8SJM3_9AQUA